MIFFQQSYGERAMLDIILNITSRYPDMINPSFQVPNDHLGLRQPVRITSLTYLSTSSSSHHLLTGTQFGDLRRYDTRAARRPVSNWKGVGKVGGVRLVEKGLSEK
jgi:ribosome biogenesis protein NSA1